MVTQTYTQSQQQVLEVVCDALAIACANGVQSTVLASLGPVWDSIGMLSVMFAIEAYNGAVISPEAIVEAKTVDDLVHLADV
jgi:acyl carrier protein